MTRLLASLLVVGWLCGPHQALAVCDPACLTCSGATAGDCTSCAAGSFLSGNPGPCVPCTSVSGCIAPPTCTDATDSHCDACAFGRYRVVGPPDACPPCTAIPGCTAPISCTNAADSECGGGCAGGSTTTTTAVTTTTVPAAVSHFNCYKPRNVRQPRFVPRRDVSVVDQFTTREVDVTTPYLLCAPASQDGSAVADPSTHLCCYRTIARGLDDAARAQTQDDFGSLQVQVRRSSLLCVPCEKTLLP
jgi:hypothetical protein